MCQRERHTDRKHAEPGTYHILVITIKILWFLHRFQVHWHIQCRREALSQFHIHFPLPVGCNHPLPTWWKFIQNQFFFILDSYFKKLTCLSQFFCFDAIIISQTLAVCSILFNTFHDIYGNFKSHPVPQLFLTIQASSVYPTWCIWYIMDKAKKTI